MATIEPTPITLAELANSASPINQIAKPATVASPRSGELDWISVAVTDAEGATPEAPVFYQQKNYMGEWVRVGAKLGNGLTDDTWVTPTDFDFVEGA